MSFLFAAKQQPSARLTRFFSIAAALAFLHIAQRTQAQEDTILTVLRISSGEKTTFDRDALEALPPYAIDTHTSVTDGVHRFEGPLMRDVLAAAEVSGDEVLAIALNDYEIAIPMSDFERFDVIAALTMDGEILTPRDWGPIWIVYPRDDHDELQDIRFDYRWVWQLTLIQAP